MVVLVADREGGWCLRRLDQKRKTVGRVMKDRKKRCLVMVGKMSSNDCNFL